jgi:hypothetical protein
LISDPKLVAGVPPGAVKSANLAIDGLDRKLEKLATEQGTAVSESWKRLHQHREDVDGLVAECLTMVTGSALRSREAESRLCLAADAMLAEVGSGLSLDRQVWTVPGPEDRTSYRTGMIALRCPARGFWSLPVALHELGHVIAQDLETSAPGKPKHNPVTAVLSGGVPKQREELFADFFATYAIGPAYGTAMVLTRFTPGQSEPGTPFGDPKTLTATHPSPDKRMHLILETLKQMDDSAGLFHHPYQEARAALRAQWDAHVQSIGPSPDLDEKSIQMLDALAGRFWSLVDDGTLQPARHRLLIGDDLELYLSGEPVPKPHSGTTVRDIVGAAWALRCAGHEPTDIEKRALALLP